jgi:class 3 adenylate cyclase
MPDSAQEQRKLAAIMFTDMVGYSALAQRNEARAIELLEIHRGIIRNLLPQHGGREVKTIGDGFLIEFPSALAAVRAAADIQRAMHERNQAVPPESQVNVRVGIHVGDVIQRDGDIHGDGVNIAARLEPLAVPGGICISSAVWELVRNKVDFPLALLGPAELKNIQLPVVVHRVVMPWESAVTQVTVRSRRMIWVGPVFAGVLLTLVLIAAHWRQWTRPDKFSATTTQAFNPTNGILFETRFEGSSYHPGQLCGQDDWLPRNGVSESGAMVVTSGSGQRVIISGADLQRTRANSNFWSGWYFRRFATNAPGLDANRISVAADFEFDPGTTGAERGFTAALLTLNDGRVAPFAGVGFTKNGIPNAQNFARPAKHLFGRHNTNTVHHLKADYDFGKREAAFEVDGQSLGSLPFNPQSDARPECVSFVLQADHAIDSVLRVDNLVVRSESK